MKRGVGGRRWREFLDQEIRAFIEQETNDNIERGMSPEEARSAALRKFGNITRVKEDTRAVWKSVWLEQLLQDARYGLRMFRRNPGFCAAVVLTLALGIGMNTAMFSVVDAALLRRVAYPDAQRLIWVAVYDRGYQSERDNWVFPGAYASFRQAASFQSMAAYGNQDLALLYRGDSATERIATITGDFWSITGAQSALGRLFRLGEPHAIVLSWELFQRRFGGNPHVIGRTVTLDGYAFHITGVLPRSFRFRFPQQLYSGDERRPIGAYIAIPNAIPKLPFSAYRAGNWEKVLDAFGPTPHAFCVIGKRKPNISFGHARAELHGIYDRLVRAHKNNVYYTHSGLRIQPLQQKLTRSLRPALLVLAGAVAFVLLIVCANVANLLLARASSRHGEIAIRRALGAARSRLMRQFLVENILFALLGGAAGLVFARGMIAAVIWLGASAVPRLTQTKIDSRVLLFTLAVSIMSAIVFGFAPAISMLRADIYNPLKEALPTSSAGSSRLRARSLLVTLEVALAVVLLSGAALMLKSFWRMTAFPLGFAPDKILTMKISLAGAHYKAWPEQRDYIDDLFRRLRRVPGVKAAGIYCSRFNTRIEVKGVAPEKQTFASIKYVSPGYLRAMGVSLLEGQWPTESDALDVVVANESFARRLAGSGNLIGRHIQASILSGTIAAVVPDFKASQLDAEPGPEVYAAYQMSPHISLITVMIRMSRNPKPMIPEVRRLISGIDRNVPAYQIETLEQELGDSIAPRRFNMFLLSSFAAAALLLVLVGIYGVVAYLVAQRTHEIGIRIALGAQRLEVVGMVMRQVVVIVVAGILIGVLAALAMDRLMTSILYGLKPDDPATFVVVTVALLFAAALACWAPARKAARIDPIVALRYE